MIRYALVLLAAMGTAAALHAVPAATPVADARPGANQTIVEKNSAFPVIGPVVFTACQTDDCSDVPNE